MYEYFDNMYAGDYLEHHGVKGMHWGIRRYQNYDGTRIGAVRRVAKNTGNALKKGVKATFRTARRAIGGTKKAINKARTEAKEAQETRAEEAMKRAIAIGDVDNILRYRDRMTSNEFKDAYSRAIWSTNLKEMKVKQDKARKEARQKAFDETFAKVTQMKDTLQKVQSLIGGNKNTKGKNKNSNQNNQTNKNQNNNNSNNSNKSSDLESRLSDFLKTYTEGMNKANSQNKQKSADGGGKTKSKDKGLDLSETWDAPVSKAKESSVYDKINPGKTNREPYYKTLSRVGKIFTDSTPAPSGASKSAADLQRERNDNWINVLSSTARASTLDRVAERNKKGWTAQNNTEWIGVLKDAANLTVSDARKSIWEERYGE